ERGGGRRARVFTTHRRNLRRDRGGRVSSAVHSVSFGDGGIFPGTCAASFAARRGGRERGAHADRLSPRQRARRDDEAGLSERLSNRISTRREYDPLCLAAAHCVGGFSRAAEYVTKSSAEICRDDCRAEFAR